MAEIREELCPSSPSKRPRLDIDELQTNPGNFSERSSRLVSSGNNLVRTEDSKDDISDINTETPASFSDRVEGSELGSSSGAVFELQSSAMTVSSGQQGMESCGTGPHASDTSFLELNDTLADISSIPSCSQTLSVSQLTTSSTLSDTLDDTTTTENEPSSSSQLDCRSEDDVMLGAKPSGSRLSDSLSEDGMMLGSRPSGSGLSDCHSEDGVMLGARPSGSGHSSPKDVNDDTSDDSDLDLELGDWQPDLPGGPIGWLQRQMLTGANPRTILNQMLPGAVSNLPDDMDEFEMWSLILDYLRMLQEPPRRKKLEDVNTFEDAVGLLQRSKKILVLTGAGVSVSCGIPDFRSRDGIYARLAVDFPDLPDPQAMFDISYFRRDPRPFFKFAKEIYPGQFRPSTSHKFINLLEQHGQLLRNYTQNIDTLEQVAGITKVVQCHGSFATAKCTNCSYKVDADAIREDIFNQIVPPCPRCPQDTDVQSVMKPEIVFFGEGLPNEFYNSLEEDKDDTDLLIVIGSSLKVRPVATIPNMVPSHIPQILINREPLRHMTFDIELLGDGDVIINELCHRLGEGWSHICQSDARLTETMEMPESPGTSAMEHETQAKEEFENMPTPPLSDQKTKPPLSLTQGNPKHTLDGVSSSSDSISCKQQQGPITNEAEAAGTEEVSEGESNKMEIVSETVTDKMDTEKVSEAVSGKMDTEKVSEAVSDKMDTQSCPSTVKLCNKSNEASNMVDSSTELAQSHMSKALCTVKKATDSASSVTLSDKEDVISVGVAVDKTSTQNLPKNSEVLSATDDKTSTSELPNDSQVLSATDNKTSTSEPPNDSQVLSAGAESDTAGTASTAASSAGVLVESSGELGADQSKESNVVVKKKRRRSSIGTYLLPSTFLFVPPSRYIFHGAEVYPPSSPECSDDEDAEARKESESDPLGLDQVHLSNLVSDEAELTDPFDPDHKVTIRHHMQSTHGNSELSVDREAHSSHLTSERLYSNDSLLSAACVSNNSHQNPSLLPQQSAKTTPPRQHIPNEVNLTKEPSVKVPELHTADGHPSESICNKHVTTVNGPDGSHDKTADISHDGSHDVKQPHKQCSSSSSNSTVVQNGEILKITRANDISCYVQGTSNIDGKS